MQPIIYDVAVSLDGFISGPSEDISAFAHEGLVVDDYLKRLDGYSTALMGRATYEFGYKYGLTPGQNPYPHLKTYVFSRTLECRLNSDVTVVPSVNKFDFSALKANSKSPIYLCGGGVFAAAMLREGLIDRVILKRNPVILGSGVRLFEGVTKTAKFIRESTKTYDSDELLEVFRVDDSAPIYSV